MRTVAAGLFCLVATACTSGFKQSHGLAADSPRTVEVVIPAPLAEAQQRVQAAAVRGGWTVTAAQPGIVTVGPYQLRQDGGVRVTLTANLAAADSAGAARTLVVLSGVRDDALGQALGRAMAGRQGAARAQGEPITQATAGRGAWSWGELTRWAAAIRGDAPAAP